MAKILLLDDDKLIRQAVELHLQNERHEVFTGSDGREGLEFLSRESFDLIITDLKMPHVSGFELLEAIRGKDPPPVIVLTGFASVESAVRAMKLGAADYIPKPPQLDEITLKVGNLLARQELVAENRRLKAELRGRFEFEGMVGRSPQMKNMLERVRAIAADGNISVLLSGESGTGKELIARAIHYNGPRAGLPFVAVDCGALPEDLLESELFGHEKGAFTDARNLKKGLFETADGGTLFLDEISSMPVRMQAKLLRALESREIRRVGGTVTIPLDIRFIAASNRDLEKLCEAGAFREDLYYRLAVAVVRLPPLRERTGDVPLLAGHFLEKFNREKNRSVTLGADVLNLLEEYRWPGNVRELENTVEIMVTVAASDKPDMSDVPARIRKSVSAAPPESDDPGGDLKSAVRRMTEKFERDFIRRSLEKNHWNITRTAEEIGLSRATLHTKMNDYGLAGKSSE